jgi:tRNA threonylcarbamoyladenosine biosynthesis protein TsaB
MKEVYGAVYRFTHGAREKLTEDRVGPVEWLLDEITGDACFLGNGAALYRERILARFPGAFLAPELYAAPRASAVAVEAVALMAWGVCTDAALVTPVYLRPSQAEVNRAKREVQQP